MIIQIIGLPGSGKTELAKALKERINAIHLNADEVRATVNSDLGFTAEDRIEQARRMGEMARLIAKQGVAPVIVDFVCPTELTRKTFGKPDIFIFMDTIAEGRFEDTEIALLAQAMQWAYWFDNPLSCILAKSYLASNKMEFYTTYDLASESWVIFTNYATRVDA